MRKCLICEKELKKKFPTHLLKEHGLSVKEYYDKYIKQPDEGVCIVCGKEVSFNERKLSYAKTCSHSCTLKNTRNHNVKSKNNKIQDNYKCPLCEFTCSVSNFNEMYTHMTRKHHLLKHKWTTFSNIIGWPCLDTIFTINKREYTLKINKNSKPINNIMCEKSFLLNISKNNLLLISNINDFKEYKHLQIKCNKCNHIFSYQYEGLSEHLNCPNCKKQEFSDKYLIIKEFLKQEKLYFLENKQTYNIEDREYKINLYIPKYNIGINVENLYDCSFISNIEHLKRTTAVKKQLDSLLIHLTDSEVMYKLEAIKSIILAKCGIFKNKIYARNCEIKQINDTEYKLFAMPIHIQGHTNTSIPLGAFYNGELVAICSFGKSRFKNSNGIIEDELIRFCCLPYTQIIGGLSKFVKYFIKNYSSGNQLMSFCDLRISNTNGYLKSGFIPTHDTEPRYWYWSKDEYWLHHRWGFQRSRLEQKENFVFIPDLSEQENCKMNGWYKYYDCGSRKMLYNGDK